MARANVNRTIYGPNKYAAFHLLLARWLRHHAQRGEYRYVTLGGTELKDAQSLHFIDPLLIGRAISFETEESREAIALQTSRQLSKLGVNIEVVGQNIFGFQ